MWPKAKTFERYAGQGRSITAGLGRLSSFLVANLRVALWLAGVVIAIAALVVGYLAWRSKQETNAADQLFRAVTQLVSQGRTGEDAARREEAVRLLRELTSRYPRTAAAAEATLRLGTLHYTLGEYDEARKIYEAYLGKNPRGRVAFAAGIGVGDTYASQEKYDQAIEAYSRLINQFPTEPLLPEAYLNLARAYLKTGRQERAVDLYVKVIEGYPGSGWDKTARSQLHKLGRR
jgi:TolA-binding protein